MSRYTITLTTLDVVPAYIAQLEVEADSLTEARDKAMSADFDDLEWTDTAGNPTPWDEIGSADVTVAG